MAESPQGREHPLDGLLPGHRGERLHRGVPVFTVFVPGRDVKQRLGRRDAVLHSEHVDGRAARLQVPSCCVAADNRDERRHHLGIREDPDGFDRLHPARAGAVADFLEKESLQVPVFDRVERSDRRRAHVGCGIAQGKRAQLVADVWEVERAEPFCRPPPDPGGRIERGVEQHVELRGVGPQASEPVVDRPGGRQPGVREATPQHELRFVLGDADRRSCRMHTLKGVGRQQRFGVRKLPHALSEDAVHLLVQQTVPAGPALERERELRRDQHERAVGPPAEHVAVFLQPAEDLQREAVGHLEAMRDLGELVAGCPGTRRLLQNGPGDLGIGIDRRGLEHDVEMPLEKTVEATARDVVVPGHLSRPAAEP